MTPKQSNNKNQSPENRKVILYIAMSLDGFIADKNDDLDFLSLVESEGEDYGYHDFTNTVDTVIIGRKTYNKVLALGFDYPHTDKDVYIITRTPQSPTGTFQFYSKPLTELIIQLKSKNGKHIYCDGGAEIVNELLNHNLIDELIISVIPILLGEGRKLFHSRRPEMKLQLISTKEFKSGLVQLHYQKDNTST